MRVLIRPFPDPLPMLVVRPAAAHVWEAPLDRLPVADADLAAALSTDERARAGRYRLPAVRDQFVRSRGLLRRLLGAYLGRPPADVVLDVGPDGKPGLRGGGGVEFNVSHTAGLAVVAVAAVPVGVDVEAVRPMPTADSLVERWFALAEREQYRGLPAELRPAGFYRAWTCKEAVLKGIGCGTRDLDRCVVDLDPRRPPGVVGPADTAAGWRVACWEPAPGYAAAVAVGTGEELEIDGRPGGST